MKHRTVLITRPREQSEELKRELEACGFHVLFLPTIQIAPPSSWEECDRALDHPQGYYDMLVFASANGVRGFFQRARERGMHSARFRQAAIYAVGPVTAKELDREGLTVVSVPEQHNAAALGKDLVSRGLNGKRVLFPRGNLGSSQLSQALSDAGAIVESVGVYRTVAAEMTGAETLLQRIFQGEIDVVAFASPSAVKNLAGVVPGGDLADLSTRTTVAAIGPSTLEMIRRLGGTGGLVATVSTAKGLAEAIAQHFGDHE